MKNTFIFLLFWLIRLPLLIFLKIFWEPFSKKKSYCWDWTKYNENISNKYTVEVAGWKGAKQPKSWLSKIWQISFGWKRVVIVSTMSHAFPFKIGFTIPFTKIQKICNLVNRPGQRVGLLVGPGSIRVFAVDLNGNQMALTCKGFAQKKDMRNLKVRLL